MIEPSRFVPSFIRSSYRRQFAAIVVVIVILTISVGIAVQGQVTTAVTTETQTNLETVAELQSDTATLWIRDSKENARMLSEYDALRSDDRAEIDALLDSELDELPNSTHAIHVVDFETKRVVESTSDEFVGTNLGRYAWADDSVAFDDPSDVAVSERFQRNDTGLVAFISPIEGTSRAVVMTGETSAPSEHFDVPVEGGYVQVVNSDGVVVIAQQGENELEAYEFGTEAEALHAGLDGQVGVTEMDEQNLVVAYAPIEGTDWALLVHAPRSSAYALQSIVMRNSSLLLGVVFSGFVVIGIALGRPTVKALNRTADNARAIASGDLDVEIDGSTREDEIGELTAAFEAMHEHLNTVAEQAQALSDQRFDADVLDREVPGTFGRTIAKMGRDVEAAQREAEQSRREIEELNEALETKAGEYSATMQRAAAGDLASRMDAESESEAMVEIGDAFNAMMDELEETIVNVQEFADEVATASEDVTVSAEEARSASEQVSESIREISEGASTQSEDLEIVFREMSNVSATIEEVAASTDQVATVADRAAERSEDGREFAETAIQEMNRMEAITEEAVAEVEALETEMNEIGEIVDVIGEITDETNMLALNASIEAARASEGGESFGVVADEIKTLAERAGQAAQEIEALITELQDSTTETVEDIREMGSRVSSGVDTVRRTADALEDIADSVDEANVGIQEINDATDQQATSTEEIVSMVEEVEGVSQRTTTEARNVSTAADEQTTSITEISDNVRTLARRADELRTLLDELDVGRDRQQEPVRQ